ncbi:vicilin-like seed storage protein At2g28490 [Magnolia sinica]|uniref:vicilin-like seed storage protein At2g28490 n=1 Tax=Magnolia sinica TaxID=86752 RepID=UPI00265AC941|nr:vicilin-like seed storage protein At2g28490 [Magnolia sinica]
MAMRTRTWEVVMLLALLVPSTLGWEYEKERGEEHEEEKGGIFLMRNSKQVMKTEGGEVRVMRGDDMRKESSGSMHIGFITMEPNTLFIPQYIDASLILFVRRGEMKIGWIYKDEMVEKNLKIGDVYRIPAGSAFYMVNTGHGQRLQIICSIDTSESLGDDIFQSFFIGGGTYPTSVLAGFDIRTLTTAFNVTVDELRSVMGRQKGGPIVYLKGSDQPGKGVTSLMQLKQRIRSSEVEFWAEDEEEKENEPKQATAWTWRKLLNSILGENRKRKGAVRSPDSYNIYDRKPDFSNNYGWSVALDENDYIPLRRSGIGVYLVNLTAGAMMAPHVNPTATEYGIILKGTGTIQVVFPNGTSAMNTKVREGDVFWVPRYFPFCQIASRSGPMEFFGFTTSARKNRPQFLVGARSILHSTSGPELAAAFDVPEERLKKVIDSQGEGVILPSWPVVDSPFIKTVDSDMVMGFD